MELFKSSIIYKDTEFLLMYNVVDSYIIKLSVH